MVYVWVEECSKRRTGRIEILQDQPMIQEWETIFLYAAVLLTLIMAD